MIKINVKKQSNYPVNTKILKEKVRNFLSKKGIVSESEISIAIIGEAKMRSLAGVYLKDKSLHNVLTFPAEESKETFFYPPDSVLHLGEIVICYPVALEEAKKEGKLIDKKVVELAEHGVLHLLGEHHDSLS